MRYGVVDHYTLALTWQPGFYGTGPGCLSNQPRAPLIGLHGLWASRPQVPTARHVSDPIWWRSGCDLLHHSDAEPVLADVLQQRLVFRSADGCRDDHQARHRRGRCPGVIRRPQPRCSGRDTACRSQAGFPHRWF